MREVLPKYVNDLPRMHEETPPNSRMVIAMELSILDVNSSENHDGASTRSRLHLQKRQEMQSKWSHTLTGSDFSR